LCDFSVAETADILSIKQGTVKESLHQARKRLKEITKTA
jgi:DNA-directed RNA polymerase specialized sigma24 family protein